MCACPDPNPTPTASTRWLPESEAEWRLEEQVDNLNLTAELRWHQNQGDAAIVVVTAPTSSTPPATHPCATPLHPSIHPDAIVATALAASVLAPPPPSAAAAVRPSRASSRASSYTDIDASMDHLLRVYPTSVYHRLGGTRIMRSTSSSSHCLGDLTLPDQSESLGVRWAAHTVLPRRRCLFINSRAPQGWLSQERWWDWWPPKAL